jgi:hypothetical protein
MKTLRLAVFALLLAISTAALNAQVRMEGDVDFAIFGSKIRVYIEDLENLSEERTGRLRLRVWASEERWDEFDRGYLIGAATVSALRGYEDRDHYRKTMSLKRPPSDDYYITITIEERVVDEEGNVTWELHDAVESDDRVYISRRRLPLLPFF